VRIGIGYDIHPFAGGRSLILGGVDIPHPQGLAGHSDADALAHAVADAVLGALGLGDIGRHFPDTDPAWAGADSIGLLARVADHMQQAGYRIGNVDAVIIAQAPKMAPHVAAMQNNLAQTLGCAPEQVNVKATTHERLGTLGRGEGIAVQAVCLLTEK